jgi:MMP 1-O-methyltransferase
MSDGDEIFVPDMEPALLASARGARGFMPDDEGLALYHAAAIAGPGPIIEVGTYCGKSSVYLGAGARLSGTVVYTIDHHRGSEEMQLGWEHHDAELVDATGRMDSLPLFRRLIDDTGLDDVVIGIVGRSEIVGRTWGAEASLIFIDGGHGPIPAHADYDLWAPRVALGAMLAIHDVFPDPADGGRPPFEIFERALATGEFVNEETVGSLRILRRVATAG